MIEMRSVSKAYKDVRALDRIDLTLSGGRIVGLLGPNGSGKTTLIKVLAGLLTADSGEALIDGIPVGVNTKSLVSYLPDKTYFTPSMTVKECLDLFTDFYADFDRQRAEDMLASLEIPLQKRFKALSKGTQEKVQLIVVMARQAKLYLLDEPIAGVDPAARDYILNTILQNYSPDSLVVISTHLISDVEAVLDDYVFLSGGKIIEQGKTDTVREELGVSLDQHFRDLFRYVLKEA
ncbi:MAG: ABC transporter ATP-binding protein [Clostridia bacterium]|nr:ABC transporter ATP-binding protein [Clostridia bacterium]